MLQEAGRVVIIVGIVLIVTGSFLWFFGKLPFLGKLPGDILVKKENFSFYAPITTTIVISILLSLLLTVISTFRK
ncbi:MAG: hypothetical protein A2700_00335 [Candidatus Blackburnbacteria bacterium RIFCSPHIGHO2_01_FULL_44_64]|uniref:DUF2905 domain-containing protein n=1 Tax=Candidatus Blackburnbacteria bacterium RIFCSPHIGHO2_02_FULL_44_20 TaxID=1797516 RepID=A0A1G1V7M0_9BACT|nr:MAG: hypothetical protein A2700_00335 [Candidatus Blackburnbacteria bacterium RIFCSPHIGHO2_01_FULL_44_64]OGY10225.1 MAG: hypothetical protein A3E16_03380 [Candidatus Blackburnbacteria bacterium RIFCSPHIGHO2_12_FULL_44_25]OGY11366.1 MAG: hypothetical protein A3D26_02575 [Candidatus Blackburnbacteria bacterium RIFCSPHIGHO2_02_FULL_44_20]OGY13542.1 MAG: hypothetical protein A3A62_01000 [Candidatus Blackburnbacteria bacterium RIFCSPLOWO2_01_FULL_44_43]OGY16762.1 MAG: hypothetical protein A3H88_0